MKQTLNQKLSIPFSFLLPYFNRKIWWVKCRWGWAVYYFSYHSLFSSINNIIFCYLLRIKLRNLFLPTEGQPIWSSRSRLPHHTRASWMLAITNSQYHNCRIKCRTSTPYFDKFSIACCRTDVIMEFERVFWSMVSNTNPMHPLVQYLHKI